MRIRTILGLILAAAVLRLLPHPPNFAPVAALALFGAATLPRRWQALAVPFAVLLLSDVGLHLLYRAGFSLFPAFHALHWVVYASFAGVVAIGFLLRRRVAPRTIALASVAASLLFFATTNVACWWDSPIYSQDLRGLLLCYEAGLPFLWPTLAGDLVYSAALFGIFAGAEARFPALRAPVQVA